MKRTLLTSPILLGLSFLLMCCSLLSPPPPVFSPTQAGGRTAFPNVLTPAKMNPVLGVPALAETAASIWPSFQHPNLNYILKYPPTWRAVALQDDFAAGFYPPGSLPERPTPCVVIKWRKSAYAAGKPLINTGGAITPISVAGVTGQQYQDSRFASPIQAHYIELPYRGGALLIITTLGPLVDLTPQMREILKTLALGR